MTNKYAL